MLVWACTLVLDTIYVSSLLKTVSRLEINLSSYIDEKLCVVALLKEYIDRTRHLRKKEDQLLISYMKPFKAVTRDTVRRWILLVMSLAGIDTDLFKAHSTRSAATSAAHRRHVPVADIMKAASWRQESTFVKFYKREVEKKNTHFAHAVLSLD